MTADASRGVPFWIALCSAAGFETTKLAIENAYALSGKIIADEVLRLLCVFWIREHVGETFQGLTVSRNVLTPGLRIHILKGMSPAARVELRERIQGVIPFKAKV